MHLHLPPCHSHLAAQGLVNLNMTELPSDASSVPAAQNAVTFKEQGFKNMFIKESYKNMN